MNNPFLTLWDTPFETVPFSKIKNHHFTEAIEAAISIAKEELLIIDTNTAPPTFTNTILPLENSGQKLDRVTSVLFNLNSAETSDELQAIAQEVSPLLSAHSNDLLLNEKLFEKVKYVFENSSLSEPQDQRLLEKTYKTFVRNGANLNKKDKERKREIDEKLGLLSLQFGQNVLKDTNDYELWIEDKNDLKGLTNSYIAQAKSMAKSKDNPTKWLVTLDYPSYLPFMKFADSEELREKLYKAFCSRGFNTANDNQKIIQEIVSLRKERAELLGYQTHADFILEERMSKSPQNVLSFLNQLLDKAYPIAKKEYKQLEEFAKSKGLKGELKPWNTSYFSEKWKKDLFDFDEEKLKPYFQLDNCLSAAFNLAETLFGISFKANNSIDVYHKEVKTFEVIRGNNTIGIFYVDFHPRPGKRSGAWMTSFAEQFLDINGTNQIPLVSIVCNFSQSTDSTPSLLTFNEFTTLLHEFGHALHGLCSRVKYKSQSGTNVPWDFVELPSQLMENWCYEPEFLNKYANHYKTNEVIPTSEIEKIMQLSNFMEASQTVRQLSFGLLDMMWHYELDEINTPIQDLENKVFDKTRLLEPIEETCMSTAFAHIFQGGYSAGYYSYKWSEVLDVDAFAYFKEMGIFNKEIGEKFRTTILEKGGSEEADVLYRKFRGRDPKQDALLKRAGLIVNCLK